MAEEKGLIIVHRTGSMNPFYYGEHWGPDRSKAHRYYSNFAAQSGMKAAVEQTFGPDATPDRRAEFVIDEYSQPAVEEALIVAFAGKPEQSFEVIFAYWKKAGLPSLRAVAQSAVGNKFHALFESWLRQNNKQLQDA